MIQTLFGSLEEPEKKSIFDRMRQAVSRTRESLNEQIDSVLAMTRTVDENALEDLEMSLIASDIGVTTAAEIVNNLRERAKRQQIRDGAELKELLKEQLQQVLDENAHEPKAVTPPEVIMMVGVNGTGKTTTSGKLAAYYRAQGKSALLCAADTFRAAAI
ncbi:MAG TPA: signal recognition particle receptor subunit alpha, partial [Acidobacteriaceae bacterium]|nr:signal recognition particle receptor subunit alpha [Acidobacteriaceae bacterium]